MDWTRAIDVYCERTGPEFWSEPINAVSNAMFIVAGIVPLIAMRRAGRQDGLLIALCLIACAVGTGSFLFHTFAQVWAALADVAPIGVFILVYLFAAMHRFFRLGTGRALAATGAAFAVSLIAAPLAGAIAGPYLNGSESYAPALALLAGCAVALRLAGHPVAGRIAAASAIFAASLTARILDPVACAGWPVGTHFLWHVLNGTMMLVLLLAMERFGRVGGPIRPS